MRRERERWREREYVRGETLRDNEYYINEIIIINKGDITFDIVHNPNRLHGFEWLHMLKDVFIFTVLPANGPEPYWKAPHLHATRLSTPIPAACLVACRATRVFAASILARCTRRLCVLTPGGGSVEIVAA